MDSLERNSKYYLVHGILMLASIEVILAFSGLGYINNTVNLALLYTPLVAGAYFFGPKIGVFMGVVLGLTTMWKASVSEMNYLNTIFSPVLSGNIFGTIVVALGTRMLFGFVAGMLFSYMKCYKISEYIKLFIVLIVSQLSYLAVLFLSLDYFFPSEKITSTNFIRIFFSFNELFILIIAYSVMSLLIYITGTKKYKEVYRVLIESRHSVYTKRFSIEAAVLSIILIIVMLGLMFHLQYKFILVTNAFSGGLLESMRSNLINIYLQFLAGIISISYILGFLLSVYRSYSIYEINHSDRDTMTGLYGKNLALDYGREIVLDKRRFPNAYFMIIDIDRFKQINDTYGHLTGDSVIIDFARFLEINFGSMGIVCRFGGDEFCVFVTRDAGRKKIEKAISKFIASISNIYLGDSNYMITCSIGIVEFGREKSFDEVYSKADKALYSVKNSGRNNYKFYSDMEN